MKTNFSNKSDDPFSDSMEHSEDDVSLKILSTSDGLPLPSNFSPTSFTIGDFDHFDHIDKNNLQGVKHTHDTAVILCQEIPPSNISRKFLF